jgi:hypothetical protein
MTKKRRMTTRKWRALIRVLRKHPELAIEGKVSVRRRPMKEYCGHTVFDGVNYQITIDTRIDAQTQAETLMHEWAHVVAIDAAFKHGKEWGEIYAKVFDLCNTDDLTAGGRG